MRPPRNSSTTLYGWHRLIGLWGALPALLIVAGGILLVFSDGLERALGAGVPVPVAAPTGARAGPGEVLATALARFPGSTLSGMAMPEIGAPWFRIRLRSPGEIPRIWGTTVLYVSTANGRILDEYPARSAGPARSFVDSIYPFHTGQIGGLAGRLLLVLIGVWLLVMIVLGISLWLARRARTRGADTSACLRGDRGAPRSPP